MSEKKSTYKGYTQSQNKATQKYIKKNLEEIRFRVKKGEKQKYKNAAQKIGMSMSTFFITAADEKIERDNGNSNKEDEEKGAI